MIVAARQVAEGVRHADVDPVSDHHAGAQGEVTDSVYGLAHQFILSLG